MLLCVIKCMSSYGSAELGMTALKQTMQTEEETKVQRGPNSLL